jgi:parallel beta-helix repeat protein
MKPFTQLLILAIAAVAMHGNAATYTVTTTADSGPGSLRQAILDGNASPGVDTIHFNIPGISQVFTITPLTPLPDVTGRVVIDGYTQPGAQANTLANGNDAVLKIELNGSLAGTNANGLSIRTSDCTIRGLVINRFAQWGIHIGWDPLRGRNSLLGNFIGTDPTGTIARGNGASGIGIYWSPQNQVGDGTAAGRNLLSGNIGHGLQIGLSQSNVVTGNYVGTDRSGTVALANQVRGIDIYDPLSTANRIGGRAPGERNVVSGNVASGIRLQDGASFNTVLGNFVGTDATGTNALGNIGSGISLMSASNVVGGMLPGDGNVISGGGLSGLHIYATATGSHVYGNRIGTDAAGVRRVANAVEGILIEGTFAAIGNGTSAGRNLISGNGANGVIITGANAASNSIQGNFIGTDQTGTAALSNSICGVLVLNSRGNTIGGSFQGARNLVSGNWDDGVSLRGAGSSNNLVEGNFIGVDINGTSAIPNGTAPTTENLGLRIGLSTASHNTARSNVISGNIDGGVSIDNGGFNNTIEGNFIGTDASGTSAVPNGRKGVIIQSGARNNLVSRNLVSGNEFDGIMVFASTNRIIGNLVGTDIAGMQVIRHFNQGIIISTGSGNIVGGEGPNDGNLVVGNRNGIMIDRGASNTVVQGNVVGLDVTGTNVLANREAGLFLLNTKDNLIGGTNAAARNTFSGNALEGIKIEGTNSRNNRVEGNFIGTDITGTLSRGNTNSGILVWRGPVGTFIGGVNPHSGNLISGNRLNGIRLDLGISNTFIQANQIGTDASGLLPLGNGIVTSSGISVGGGTDTFIGGVGSAGNIIGANSGGGIHIYAPTTNTVVQGNWIGIGADGMLPLPNGVHGVWSEGGVGNRIGGPTAGEANVIAYNLGDGVYVQTGTGQTISGNSIFNNAGLGIDLGANGVAINDAGDGDSGANNLLNYPSLITAATESTTFIEGEVRGPAGLLQIVEFFASDAPDASGRGEGALFIGSIVGGPALNARFEFAPATPVPPGKYITATATDPFGNTSEFSSPVRVSSLTLPDIVTHPSSRTARSGSNVTFSVQANGPALVYQWFFNGSPIPAANAPVLAINAVQSNLAGDYHVLVTNPFGSNSSQVAQLTVSDPPVFLVSPQSQTAEVGNTIVLTVTTAGTLPITYRWLKGATIKQIRILNAHTDSLTLTNVQLADAGGYRVTVTNIATQTQAGSSTATLTVLASPSFGLQPASTNVPLGGTATFCVSASGTAPVVYQWRHNGANIDGATNACLAITNVQLADGGAYDVVLENVTGTLVSDEALLTIDVPAALSGDNFGDRVPLGNAFTNAVSGTNHFATREDNEPLHAGKAGGKSVWYSWTAPAKGIATFRTVGSSFDTLLAVYTGDSLLSLANVASDEDSGGFFTSSLQFNAQGGVTYAVAIDGFAGAEGAFILSWELEETVEVLPHITAQPASQTVLEGAAASFSVSASGGGLGYQWLFNGAMMPGETGSTLIVSNVQPKDIGYYSVRVSNSSGRAVQSDIAILEIGPQAGVQSRDKFGDLLAMEELAPAPTGGRIAKAITSAGFLSLSAGLPLSFVVNTTNSTTERSEPVDCRITGASRWMTLRAIENGVCLIDTIGSSIDTTLSVYTGSNYLTLHLVACDDNGAADGVRSLVKFAAVAGTDYRLRIDGVGNKGIVRVNTRLGVAPELAVVAPVAPPITPGGPFVLQAPVLTNSGTTLIYRWFLDGNEIPHATNANYALGVFGPEHAGQYAVRIENEFAARTYTWLPATLQVPLLDPAPRMINGALRLHLHRPPNQTLVIEGSDDLQTWTPIHTIPLTAPGPDVDIPIMNQDRFFRARPWP